MNNKLVDLKNELKYAVAKNTFTYNGHTLTPLIQQVYLSLPTIGGSMINTNTPVQPPQVTTQLCYQLSSPNGNSTYITEEQIEVLAHFVKILDYREDFEEISK